MSQVQVSFAQFLSQFSSLDEAIAAVSPPTQDLSDTLKERVLENSVCTVANKDGSVCKITPAKGTSVCHIHTRVNNKSSSKAAKATADLKANRKGAGIAAGDLDAEMQAGTGKIYFHSNGGCKRINQALRKREWKVSGITKHADGSRTWDVTGHGQAYTHYMGVFKLGQANHHRQMIKV